MYVERCKYVQVNHHDNIDGTIKEYQNRDWSLHTYSNAQLDGHEIDHYIQFDWGNDKLNAILSFLLQDFFKSLSVIFKLSFSG